MTNQTSPEQSAAPAACEWQMVPKEPTREMIQAGKDANPTVFRKGTDRGFEAGVANDIFRAMLAAAPSPAPVPTSPLAMGVVKAALEWADAKSGDFYAANNLATAVSDYRCGIPPSPRAEENARLIAAVTRCVSTLNLVEQFVPEQVQQRGLPISLKELVPGAVAEANAALAKGET